MITDWIIKRLLVLLRNMGDDVFEFIDDLERNGMSKERCRGYVEFILSQNKK